MNQMAQMPVVMSVGGKAGGLSFDHVLHKLQVRIFFAMHLPSADRSGGTGEEQGDQQRASEPGYIHDRYTRYSRRRTGDLLRLHSAGVTHPA